MKLVWTAWNNGQHHASGAGYGIKVPLDRRDSHFDRSWQSVTMALPTEGGLRDVEVNIAKASFWSDSCRELISAEIGKWLIKHELAPWPTRKPPKLEVESMGDRRFVVKRALTS